MKRIAVLTSGGDSPGMNAAIRAIVRSGASHGLEVFGVKGGYSGLIAGDIVRLGVRDVGGIIGRGGTILGTTRCERIKSEAGQMGALRQLQERDISSLVVIGGNGSQAAACELSRRGLAVAGVASTIDNDPTSMRSTATCRGCAISMPRSAGFSPPRTGVAATVGNPSHSSVWMLIRPRSGACSVRSDTSRAEDPPRACSVTASCEVRDGIRCQGQCQPRSLHRCRDAVRDGSWAPHAQ